MIKNKEDLLKHFLDKNIDKNKKLILKKLAKKDMKPTELAKECKLSTPLIAFHTNGNKQSEGLVELGLIERVNDHRGIFKEFKISKIGKDILKIVTSAKVI